MGWGISEKGFQIVLSPTLPQLIVDHLGHDVDAFLADHGLARKDNGCWMLDMGGPKSLKQQERRSGCQKKRWGLRRSMGNLSSASVLRMLEEVFKRQRQEAGTYLLLAAMGPGFCPELVLLRWN
jgi:alkylresorcinol/alkylpyrone synthase